MREWLRKILNLLFADKASTMNNLRWQVIISLIATIPVILFSERIQYAFHFEIDLPWSGLLYLIGVGVVYWYGAWPFYIECIREIRYMHIGMMTLIIAIIMGGYFYSLLVLFNFLSGVMVYEEIILFVDFVLIIYYINSFFVTYKSCQ